MATYYVSQAGSGDGLGGDISNTMSMASFNSGASAGNVYYLTGTITTSINCPSGSLDSEIEIRGDYPGYAGHVSVSTAYCMQCTGGVRSHYKVINLQMTTSAGGACIATNGDNYYIEGCTLTSTKRCVVFSSGRTMTYAAVKNCIMNPGVAADADCILWAAVSGSYTLSNIEISGNTIIDPGRYGIDIQNTAGFNGCDNWNISDNEITGSVNAAIRISSDSELDNVTNLMMEDNYIHDNNAGGIALYNVSGVIRNNIIEDNDGVTGGIDLFYSSNVNIYKNICSGHTSSTQDGNGILIDYGCSNIWVHDNLCDSNVGNGSNINSGCGIMILGGAAATTNVEVYGNVGTGNRHGLWVAGVSIGNVRFYNNTFIDCIDDGIIIENQVPLNEVVLSNTILTGNDSGYAVNDYNTGNAQTHVNNCLYGWTNAYKNMTIDTSEFINDPLLDDSYKPAPNSPCVGNGTTPLSKFDHYMRPLQGNDDVIGAVWPDYETVKTRRKL